MCDVVSWAGQPIITAFICNYDIVLTSNILVLEYTNTTFNMLTFIAPTRTQPLFAVAV